jgi:hypothetical protein
MRLILLSTAALILAASPAAAKAVPSPVLAKIIADYDILERRFHPDIAAQDGDREALSRLEDDSPATLAVERLALQAIDARLSGLPPSDPSSEDAVNRGYLAFQLRTELTDLALDTARINFDAYSGFHLEPQELGRQTHIRDRADADAYLKRLKALPAYYATQIANARRGIATGFTQPAPTVQVVLAIARKQTAIPAAEDGLMGPLNDLPPSIPVAEQKALRADGLRWIQAFKPSEAALVLFLEQEYAPHARLSLAARDLPNGEAYYRAQVAEHTTTGLTPDQIHQIGLDEVKRIRAAMEAEIKASGFSGDFKAFQQFLHTDPRFYVTTREALLEKSAMFAKTVDDKLPHEFGRLPRLPFAVREIPRESEESATTAYYEHRSALVPAQRRADRLRRGLGALFRAARRRNGALSNALRAVRPPELRDVAGVPPGRRHRHPLAALESGSGARLLHRKHRPIAQEHRGRARSLYLLARPGAWLQDRRTEDHAVAPSGRSGARAEVRRTRLPRCCVARRTRTAGPTRKTHRRLDRTGEGAGVTNRTPHGLLSRPNRRNILCSPCGSSLDRRSRSAADP